MSANNKKKFTGSHMGRKSKMVYLLEWIFKWLGKVFDGPSIVRIYSWETVGVIIDQVKTDQSRYFNVRFYSKGIFIDKLKKLLSVNERTCRSLNEER